MYVIGLFCLGFCAHFLLVIEFGVSAVLERPVSEVTCQLLCVACDIKLCPLTMLSTELPCKMISQHLRTLDPSPPIDNV